MEELDLTVKYRSRNLAEYEGNEYAKTVIQNNFALGKKYPPTVLMTGPSGCGKTTLARLLLKHIIVECRHENDGHPCGDCLECLDFDEYIATGSTDRLYNVQEVDATIDGGKKAIAEVIDDIMRPTVSDDIRGYILDEAHMLTDSAQNALLKAMEDAPSGVIIILCTTNPERLLDTVRNRCRLQIPVQKPNMENVVNLLTRVCNAEGVQFEKAGLKLIAERSEFVFRSSLANLDLTIKMKGNATLQGVSDALGVQNTDDYFKFFDYLLSHNTVLYTQLMHDIKVSGDFKRFVHDIKDFIKRGLYVKSGITIEGMLPHELKRFKALFDRFTIEQIYVLLETLEFIEEGDIESRLFLLGYRGLNRKKYDDVDDTPVVITEVDKDIEKARISQVKEVRKQSSIEDSTKRMESDTEVVSMDDLLKAFNN